MQDLVNALEARREEIRQYLKSAEQERTSTIELADLLGGNIRNAESDLKRVEQAIKALVSEDIQTVPREQTLSASENLKREFSGQPVLPRSVIEEDNIVLTPKPYRPR